jgi:hypothetical protein
MATDLIRYDLLVQDALRDVVRRVLSDAAREGLPGEHYFYVTFQTHARGVRLSARMREQYPEEMTIVLQHQFWDLTVSDQGFEVGLSFKNVPEKLLIPFEAITRFTDPAVEFDLRFEPEEEIREASANDLGPPETQTAPLLAFESEPRGELPETAPQKPGEVEEPAPAASLDMEKTEPGEANVISIDAFRKKT